MQVNGHEYERSMFLPVIGWSDDMMDPLNGRAKWERGMSMAQGMKQTHSERYRILSSTPECSVKEKGKEKEKEKEK